MIDSFRKIGSFLLKDINFTDLSIDEKYRLLKLNSLSFENYIFRYKSEIKINRDTKKKIIVKEELYPLIINFNTIDKRIELSLAKIKDLEQYLFLEKKSANSKKISFSSNNSSDILNKSIVDLLKLIEDSKNSKFDKFKSYLKNIYGIFYSKICEINTLEDITIEYNLDKEDSVNLKTPFNLKVKTNSLISNLTILKIDGRYILDTEFKDLYLSLVFDFYYGDLINKTIIPKFSLPLKFYIMDKIEFSFDNSNDFDKSFKLSTSEFFNIFTGMNYIKNNQRNLKFLDTKYYIIPHFSIDFNISENLDLILDRLKLIFGYLPKIAANFEAYKDYENIYFNLLFYDAQQASFKIVKNFPDLDLLKLNYIYELLLKSNSFYSDLKYKFYLKDIKFMSGNSLNLLYNIYYNIDVDIDFILIYFLKDLKSKFYNKSSISKLNLDFSILNFDVLYNFLIYNNNLNIILEDINMNIQIENEDLISYFDNYNIQNNYKKGLITFGYLIGNLLYKQKEKSKTFIQKIGFDGLDSLDLKELYNQLLKYEILYKINLFNQSERSFVGSIIDSCDKSGLTKLENNFFILLGVQLSRYFGLKYSKDKKNEIENNLDENGDLE